MTQHANHPDQKRRSPITVASALALLLCLPISAAVGEDAPPPVPKDFKAMQNPSDPAKLITPPSASLITPSTGPVNPPAGFTGSKMVMNQAVWQAYIQYVRNDVAMGFGFFMITVDGKASDVKKCNNYACQISPLIQETALSDCRTNRGNRRCIVFAEGRNIKYGYQVVP